MSDEWRNDLATEKQKEKLRFFGCTWDEGITAGQASDALEDCARQFPDAEADYQKNQPATENQKEKLRFFGCTWNGDITVGKASDALEECAREFPEKEADWQFQKKKWSEVPDSLERAATIKAPTIETPQQYLERTGRDRDPNWQRWELDKAKQASNFLSKQALTYNAARQMGETEWHEWIGLHGSYGTEPGHKLSYGDARKMSEREWNNWNILHGRQVARQAETDTPQPVVRREGGFSGESPPRTTTGQFDKKTADNDWRNAPQEIPTQRSEPASTAPAGKREDSHPAKSQNDDASLALTHDASFLTEPKRSDAKYERWDNPTGREYGFAYDHLHWEQKVKLINAQIEAEKLSRKVTDVAATDKEPEPPEYFYYPTEPRHQDYSTGLEYIIANTNWMAEVRKTEAENRRRYDNYFAAFKLWNSRCNWDKIKEPLPFPKSPLSQNTPERKAHPEPSNPSHFPTQKTQDTSPLEVTIQEATTPRNSNPNEYTIPANEVQRFASQQTSEATKLFPQILEPHIAALKNPNKYVRRVAVVALGRSKDPQAIKPLITCLADASWEVRIQTVRSLGEFNEADAVEALINALRDREASVRKEAADALGKIKGVRAVVALTLTLQDRAEFVRKAAAGALRLIEGDEFVPVTQGKVQRHPHLAARPQLEKPVPQEFVLDMDKVKSITKETREVVGILSVLMEDEPKTSVSGPEIPKVSDAIKTALKPSPFNGLDAEFHPILERLLARDSWPKNDFKSLADEFHFMPSKIHDTLNEWADEVLGDFILDGEDPVIIHRELIAKETIYG